MRHLESKSEAQFWLGGSIGFLVGAFLMLMMVQAVLVY